MNKIKIIIVSIILFFIIIIIFMKNKKDNNYGQIYLNKVIYESSENNYIEKSENIDDIIKVHITGEVNNPGLIELTVGSRINDAIDLAGGLTSEADISKTNLAYILSDGEKIYIPNKNDDEEISIESNHSIKININTANLQELKTIPGVGEATANSIIEYRDKNRKIFRSWRYTKCFWNRSK